MDDGTIDITKICLRNELLRMINKKTERELLSSIIENGIIDPLLGFFDNNFFVLIDGFKRYRCCQQLSISSLPIETIAPDEASSLIKTLKISNSKSLHILEQAKFIKQLKDRYQMTATDVAASLNKSVYWVTTRLTLLKELTPLLEEKIFKGQFPVWNAMGILHQSKRSKIATDEEIDNFVSAVSNKNLSVRDIDILAGGYFKGGDEFRQQVMNGNLTWSINKLKDIYNRNRDLGDNEKRILKDLEIASKYIGRIIINLPRIKRNNDIISTAGLLVDGILKKLTRFQSTLSDFVQKETDDN